jgi:hypothetical protein
MNDKILFALTAVLVISLALLIWFSRTEFIVKVVLTWFIVHGHRVEK